MAKGKKRQAKKQKQKSANALTASSSKSPASLKRVKRANARYDAAQTTSENTNHWALADGFSADVAAAPGVRRILRNRSRYEVGNNSYYRGSIDTDANDIVGTGPRLNMSALLDKEHARFVEKEFSAWMEATELADKLACMRRAYNVDGEGFGLYINNDALRTPVKLDLRLIEAEQCASYGVLPDRNAVDGIRFDAAGNAKVYDILMDHPGGGAWSNYDNPVPVSANQVLHYFKVDRPGQRRGIPTMTSALGLFAMLRRWTLSVLAAAETAADFAAIMMSQKNAVDDDNDPADADPFEEVEIARRMMMTLPKGWDMKQFKAEQPISTYAEFKREVVGEIARCISMPINVILGDSSKHNYASGRLDWQIYGKKIKVDRKDLTLKVLDPIFYNWLDEAIKIEGYLPQALRHVNTDWAHTWYWDGQEHVDPAKEANAQGQRLKNLTTTLADEFGKQGKDWERELEQIARERQKMAALGLTMGDVAPLATVMDPEEIEDEEELSEADRIAQELYN